MAGATLRVMETLSDPPKTEPGLPLTEEGQAALRVQVLLQLANLPFPPGAKFSRGLWLIYTGPWGVWTHAVLPIDGRLDLPDRQRITGLCHLLAGYLEHPLHDDGDRALVVLHRPGTAGVSRADMYIYDLLRAAADDRAAASWTFYVAGPDGVRELS